MLTEIFTARDPSQTFGGIIPDDGTAKVGAVARSYEHHGNHPGPNTNGVGRQHKRRIRSVPALTPEVTAADGIKMNSHSATG